MGCGLGAGEGCEDLFGFSGLRTLGFGFERCGLGMRWVELGFS